MKLIVYLVLRKKERQFI